MSDRKRLEIGRRPYDPIKYRTNKTRESVIRADLKRKAKQAEQTALRNEVNREGFDVTYVSRKNNQRFSTFLKPGPCSNGSVSELLPAAFRCSNTRKGTNFRKNRPTSRDVFNHNNGQWIDRKKEEALKEWDDRKAQLVEDGEWDVRKGRAPMLTKDRAGYTNPTRGAAHANTRNKIQEFFYGGPTYPVIGEDVDMGSYDDMELAGRDEKVQSLKRQRSDPSRAFPSS